MGLTPQPGHPQGDRGVTQHWVLSVATKYQNFTSICIVSTPTIQIPIQALLECPLPWFCTCLVSIVATSINTEMSAQVVQAISGDTIIALANSYQVA